MTPERWAQIDRLYHAALETSPAERDAFLRDACATDASLREEVESLLKYESAANAFLIRPALQEAARNLAARTEAAPSPSPTIPGYTILRVLGEGGMGVVYLAEQHAPLRRQVALKLIKAGMDSRQVLARFDLEREALARMDHPGIAAVFDAGQTPDGRPYFVMECIDGLPITEYCDRHRLPTRTRLELFQRVCAAVQHAHQKGVIHRDVKPSNVLVTEQDGQPLPKVIDFGTAKAMAPQLARDGVTDLGLILGTLEYMSPEQAALSSDIDTTTDVYSLGVLLYELLVGDLPFDRHRLRAASYDEMRRVIRESDPPRPSRRLTPGDPSLAAIAAARNTDAGRLARQLAGDVDWIILRALERDRRRRYQTVAGLAADIRRFLEDEPVDARPPSAAYRVMKFARRYRRSMLAAAVLLVVLAAGFMTSTALYFKAEHSRLESEYRAFVATIRAADADLRAGMPQDAQASLLTIPEADRDWEWHHLYLRTDSSIATLQPVDLCGGSVFASDDVLRLDASGRNLSLKRCDVVQAWDAETLGARPRFQWSGITGGSSLLSTVVPARTPKAEILAVSASNLVLARSRRPEGSWELRLVRLVHRWGSGVAQPEVAALGPFEITPHCADISADGTRVVVGLEPPRRSREAPQDDVFEVWDTDSGRRLVRVAPRRLRGRPDPRSIRPVGAFALCRARFSPDGKSFASSGATVHVWATESGVELRADSAQAGSVSQPIAFSPDGGRLAIGRSIGVVDLLFLGGLRPSVQHLYGFGLPPFPENQVEAPTDVPRRSRTDVLTVAFSPDGMRVVSGRGTEVSVWSLADRRLMAVRPGHAADVVGVVVSADGRRIFSADTSGVVKVWSEDGPTGISRVMRQSVLTTFTALSPDGTAVATGERDGSLSVRQLAETVAKRVRLPLNGFVMGPALLSAGGRVLLVGLQSPGRSEISTFAKWDVQSGETATIPANLGVEGQCSANANEQGFHATVAISPDSQTIAHDQGDCVVVRSLTDMKLLATIPDPHAVALAFRPDGTLLVSSRGRNGTGDSATAVVRIWDWHARRSLVTVTMEIHAADSIALSRDGTRIAFSGGWPTQVVSIWDGSLGRRLGQFQTHGLLSMAFSPTGSRIVTSHDDNALRNVLRVWDASRFEQVVSLPDAYAYQDVVFTADGRIVAARASGDLAIWESKHRVIGDR